MLTLKNGWPCLLMALDVCGGVFWQSFCGVGNLLYLCDNEKYG